jgi:DNA polymerase III alpha subunit
MQYDQLGNVIYQEKDIFDLIYSNKVDYLSEILIEKTASTQQLKTHSELNLKLFEQLDVDQAQFDAMCQTDWFMPSEYRNMDIEGFLVNLCPKQNYPRLIEELQEFQSRNMIDILRVLKYVVDTLHGKNVLWGVGRGSSVASYALFLIGVHKIDSVKYDLDWREFLR